MEITLCVSAFQMKWKFKNKNKIVRIKRLHSIPVTNRHGMAEVINGIADPKELRNTVCSGAKSLQKHNSNNPGFIKETLPASLISAT